MKCPDCFRDITEQTRLARSFDTCGQRVMSPPEYYYTCIHCEDERIKMDDRRAKYQQEGDDEKS